MPVAVRAALLTVAITLTLLPSADSAWAGNASMKPSVQGYGFVTASGYSCSNFNQDDRVIQTACAVTTVIPPMFGEAVIRLTPSAFSNNGNAFARWEGCELPPGTPLASATVAGTDCVLTVSFFGPNVQITPRAVFDDTAGPTISAVTPTYSTSTDRGVSFGLSVNESFSVAECSIDSGPFAPCGTVRQVGEGTHSVRARGVDLSGNTGPTTAPSTFRVIDTTLVSGPDDFSAVKRPTFTYSTQAGVRFECSIDSVAISTPCGERSPTTNTASFTPPDDLADGLHTFRVEAIDGPDFDRVPVVRTWRVDTVAPVVTDLASPTVLDGIVTTARSATFTWAATDVGGMGAFECRLDGGAFEPCTSPRELTDLSFGQRQFAVRAVDLAGNVGAAVSRTWTVAAPDSDGDGFDARSDCDDTNPRINPNATDVAGNGVDENCDGADATVPPVVVPPSAPAPAAPATPPATGGGASSAAVLVPARLSAKGLARGKRITFKRLTATLVPVGARLTVTCVAGRGGACPFKTKSATATAKTVNLLRMLAGKRARKLAFGAPAVVTVTVSNAGMTTRTLRYRLVKGKFPKRPAR